MANVSSFSGAMPVIPGGTVELGYSQITSSVSPTSTTTPASTEVVAPMTVVCDGGPVLVEFWCPYAQPGSDAGNRTLTISLFVDSSENQRYFGYIQTPTTGNSYRPVHLMYRMTPSAGSHTFGIKAFVSGGTGTIGAGSGAGGANDTPAFLRVSKIVNQNDGLKPFWTPPVVTQLPSQATVGDQVIYAANATDGVYWHLQYDGLGTYPWKFIGGAALRAEVDAQQSTTLPSFTDLASAGPSITVPLAGDYDYRLSARVQQPGSSYQTTTGLAINGTVGASDQTYIYDTLVGSHEYAQMLERRKTGLSANDVLKVMYKTSGGTAYWATRNLYVTPIRVKAA